VRSVGRILGAPGWGDDAITRSGLKKLRKAVLAAKHTSRLKLPGLKSARAPVFPGGLAILLALFDRLEVEHMVVSSGALREGVMYDLLGRIRHEDVRERTIRSFQSRYRVDVAQAARVERTALALLSHRPESWDLNAAEDGRVLAWAARLHEIGLAVSWSRHHRHGGYLIAHADMPGFSKDDQELLAAVVRCHRRKIDPQTLARVSGARRQRAIRLIILLRLAVLLHRGRSPVPLPPFRLDAENGRVCLHAPERWLTDNPLSVLDLDSESGHLKTLDVDFALA
jgi:exopolyphosphatase/guanosine-5'-triphosphate,3'-diphosphate pyrophosphatase